MDFDLEHVDLLEKLLDKIEIHQLIDRMMPLPDEHEQQFRDEMRLFLEETDPAAARLLAACDFDVSRVDVPKLRRDLAKLRESNSMD
jgi:hypothetical protein